MSLSDSLSTHSVESTPSTCRRRSSRRVTPREKMFAILRVQNGEAKASVARSISVPVSTFRGWCKNQSKIFNNSVTPQNYHNQLQQRQIINENFEPLDYRKKVLDSRQETAETPYNLSPMERVTPISFDENKTVLSREETYGYYQNYYWYRQFYRNQQGFGQENIDKEFNEEQEISVNSENDEMIDIYTALKHGDKFLTWLETNCENPKVTALQIAQFKTLLKKLKR